MLQFSKSQVHFQHYIIAYTVKLEVNKFTMQLGRKYDSHRNIFSGTIENWDWLILYNYNMTRRDALIQTVGESTIHCSKTFETPQLFIVSQFGGRNVSNSTYFYIKSSGIISRQFSCRVRARQWVYMALCFLGRNKHTSGYNEEGSLSEYWSRPL